MRRWKQNVRGTPLILCGSAFGEMRKLIDGNAPLRGRAILELVLQPFDFRTAAEFWGLGANQQVAFAHNASVGGTPAYRTLADHDAPTDGDLDGWVIRRLLEPSSRLFRDGRIVVAEDQQKLGPISSGIGASLQRWPREIGVGVTWSEYTRWRSRPRRPDTARRCEPGD